ncbi:1-acyl-sn-glycerol-3-phosphate acyltransferase [Clostridium tepidiprofundi DSM 19306]|uniref:1-acyl-sn-glycerol-3-phosphate acyltransferase n=1 Tax=Clostridium tepidiprofundi DSM 19306 TaxID=1121338 RepID=A0A151B4A9_9CLOT|nr:lysophospholipid acyltransferase family protein [Clostridium tepidiprofundi]KYH34748.1 1-acyl-sn-glycerol-3-phosphate acyltransferase [Clostridium tepidiprofundi DSM 19306]
MKRFLFYSSFIAFLIKANFYKIKYEKIKKRDIDEANRYLDEVVMEWANFVIDSIGIDLEVIGRENIPNKSCLFVSNHQSNLDIPALLSAVGKPIGLVAKKEMEKLPIMPYWMNEMHCVFIDRENPREGLKAINKGAENLKQGYSMAIFPEGTRSKGSKMGEFKKGSLKMALKAKVPVVPVTIDGTYKSLEAYDKKSKRFDVKIIFDKPIEVKELSREESAKLLEDVRDIIEKNLKEK